jgi:two-component system LytT family sensor kinase
MAGVFSSTAALLTPKVFPVGPEAQAALFVAGKQSVLLIVLGAFLLFARFRFGDVFLQQSLRILLAVLAAVALVFLVEASAPSPAAVPGGTPATVRTLLQAIVAGALLLLFARLDRQAARLVNVWILGAPDYRGAARELGNTIRGLHREVEITAHVEDAVRRTLGVDGVHAIDTESVGESAWPFEIQEGDPVELEGTGELQSRLPLRGVELLVPVRAGGRVSIVLAITPGPDRRGFLSQEVSYLRSVAALFGGRLDQLGLEREAAERQHRETRLLQQLTEAELRALRAQVNPHFLFNSLNTIANLIVTNPTGAEAMTLRLAKVFRHVLSRSSRPLTSLCDEIAFLRTYLEIEKARFGDRLQVDIDVPPEVSSETIPSLILQPVVENALRHGLAPKPGPGRLRIAARAEGDAMRLTVEDDGLGPDPQVVARPSRRGAPGGDANPVAGSAGVGLANVRQRLAALYRDRAVMSLERQATGGTRVTIVVPRMDGGRAC